jgi:branched-chain amino acid transport system permease protein
LVKHKTDDSTAVKSINNKFDSSPITYLMIVLISVAAPFFIYPPFLMKVLCFALLACSFNLLLGYGGMLSFGHAAFYGGGSYMAAVAAKTLGIDPFSSVVLGGLFAAVVGIAFGYISIKRQGIYFSMITLALAQMCYFFIVQSEFSGNDEGIQAVPRGNLFGIDLSDQLNMYFFVLAFFLVCFFAINTIIRSPFGLALKSIRDNEPRALSLGYSTDTYKLMAFVLSALFAGIAGALDALTFQLASLTNVHWTMSGHAILMTIIGGVSTMVGPLIGAIVVAALENYLAHLGTWVYVVQGVIFMFCVLAFRKGIVGEISDLINRRKS